MAFALVAMGNPTGQIKYWATYMVDYQSTNPNLAIRNVCCTDVDGVYGAYAYVNGSIQPVFFSQYNVIASTIAIGWYYYNNPDSGYSGSGIRNPTYVHNVENDIYYYTDSNWYPLNISTVDMLYWSVYGSLEQAIAAFGEYVHNPQDPYSPGGSSGTGGGEGTFDIINDDVDFPDTPTASAVNANFISIWTPTIDQIQTLAKWLWNTDPLQVNFWQKLIQNPLELIFSLSIMPVPIFHTTDTGTPSADEIVAQNDSLSLGWQDTGIKMDWITDQYVTIDMGTITLEEIWGAFLDYEPYTKIDIYLPYIGVKQLDTNDCMPRNITLRYVIDLATGTCVAMIKCDNSVYYHFSGNCASQIPITVNQCQEIVRGLMTMVVGAASFALGGQVGAGAHASKAAIKKGAAMQTAGSVMMGAGADNAAKGVTVSRSGTISCAAGLMGVQKPYLIISRPRQALPEDQFKYTGYPSFITEDMSALEGYTEVQIIHLHNMTCTDAEINEIDELLRGGVIF